MQWYYNSWIIFRNISNLCCAQQLSKLFFLFVLCIICCSSIVVSDVVMKWCASFVAICDLTLLNKLFGNPGHKGGGSRIISKLHFNWNAIQFSVLSLHLQEAWLHFFCNSIWKVCAWFLHHDRKLQIQLVQTHVHNYCFEKLFLWH